MKIQSKIATIAAIAATFACGAAFAQQYTPQFPNMGPTVPTRQINPVITQPSTYHQQYVVPTPNYMQQTQQMEQQERATTLEEEELNMLRAQSMHTAPLPSYRVPTQPRCVVIDGGVICD